MDTLTPRQFFAFVAAATFGIAWLILRHCKSRMGHFPPGPPPKPIVGNLFDMPGSDARQYEVFSDLARKYGDIVHLNLLGTHLVVLHSEDDIADLLVKRSATTSDRPRLVMAKLTGWEDSMAIMSYTDRLRHSRRLMARIMAPQKVADYMEVIEEKTFDYARKLIAAPMRFAEIPRWSVGAFVAAIVYGYDVRPENDPWLACAEEASLNFVKAATPGWLVDVFPPLRHIPSWFPGAGFKRKAAEWSTVNKQNITEPFQFVKSEMARGTARDSFTSALLEDEGGEKDESIVMSTSNTIFMGAMDTTIATTLWIYVMLAQNQDVQRRAQDEIDNITQLARLPTHADRIELPYVNATLLEVFRCNPAVPLGVSHVTSEEHELKGYRIPAGTIVLGNVWHLLHDPIRYKDPMTFRPERFLGPNPEEDPRNYVFGFGRRECPGRHFADASLFMTLVITLAVFNTRPPVDDNGVEVVPAPVITTGITRHPADFKCDIRPRSDAAAALLA